MKGLPGFRDFYPEPIPTADSWSMDLRRYIFDTWRGTAERYGFREYDGPPIEELGLYTKKSGDEIVGQRYNFNDKGDRGVSLRPEMTPTLARMAASHSRNYKKPIKWFSIPQLFRYERQQKGRLREHFQLNADILGEENLAADAPGKSFLKTAAARKRKRTTFTRSSTNSSAKTQPSPARNWPSLVFRTTR